MPKLVSGAVIVEVMLGFAVVMVGLMAILQLSNRSMAGAGVAQRQAQATGYANEGLDWVKGQVRVLTWQGFLNLAAVSTDPPAVYCLNELKWPAAGACSAETVIHKTEFTRQLEMLQKIEGTNTLVGAKIEVSWIEGERTVTTNRQYDFVPF
jgi:hypothetical protein